MHVSEEKIRALKKKMEDLDIKEKDIKEKFILGSGPGGQKIQKSHSCVYIKHLPTNIEVKCQQDRMRETNRYFARKLLCEEIERRRYKEKSEKEKEIAKKRKQKKRRSRKAQKKIIEGKRQLSQKKMLRKPIDISHID